MRYWSPLEHDEVVTMPTHVLQRLDGQIADKVAHYQHRETTVEHVLPQNPGEGSEGLEMFPNAEDMNRLSPPCKVSYANGLNRRH